MPTVHDFVVSNTTGAPLPLATYSGQVLLLVNVASKCGLTPQYTGLEELHRTYKDRGLVVLGFPSNQFMEQEPGTDQEIQEFCRVAYDVSFPILAKVDVNGPNATPLYKHLRTQAPGDFGPKYGNFYDMISKIKPDADADDVKWNFTKFLVGRDGAVVKRYESPVTPEQISKDLDTLL